MEKALSLIKQLPKEDNSKMGSFARDCLQRCGWSAEGSPGPVRELYSKGVRITVTPGPEGSRTEEGESKIQDPGYFPRGRTFF